MHQPISPAGKQLEASDVMGLRSLLHLFSFSFSPFFAKLKYIYIYYNIYTVRGLQAIVKHEDVEVVAAKTNE
jgi:hypothetical protein